MQYLLQDESRLLLQGVTSPVWRVLAWQDIVARYRRSTFGPFWITLATAIFVVCVGSLYAGLFSSDGASYMLYLGTGFIIWQLIASCLTEGATTLIDGHGIILNARIEPITLILRMVARNVIILFHNLPVYFALVLYAHSGDWSNLPLVVPGLLALAGNILWLSVATAILALRFRDIPQVIQILTRFLFMVTPIFWSVQSLPQRSVFELWNPFAHMLSAVREPLIGHPAPLSSVVISLGVAVVGTAATTVLYLKVRRRIHYWV